MTDYIVHRLDHSPNLASYGIYFDALTTRVISAIYEYTRTVSGVIISN